MENTNKGTLELGLQELEAMEAPGFWSGFKDGLIVGGGIVGAAAASAAIAT